MNEEKIETIRSKYGMPRHYYGDTVRSLFILAAVIMIATLPFLTSRLPVPPTTSIIAIVALSIVAGLLSPRGKLIIWVNLFVSTAALLTFEYYAVQTYKMYSFADMLFWVDQILAIIFLFSLYYSAKTVRSLAS